MLKAPARFAIGVTAAALLAIGGCGGGAGIPTKTYTLSVTWPQRVRDITAPASAQSLRMVIKGILPNGSDYEMILNRPKELGPVTKTYTFKAAFLTIATPVYVDFLSDYDASGQVVANGSGTTTTSGNGVTGSNISIPAITASSKIATLVVPRMQRLDPFGSKDLQFSALDSSGAIIAIPYGACLWATEDESIISFFKGTANGVGRGWTNVTARVDGLTSAPTRVMVLPKLATLSIIPGQQIKVGATGTVNFSATDANGAVVNFPNDEAEYESLNTGVLKFVNSRPVGVSAGNALVNMRYKNSDGSYTNAFTETWMVVP